MDVCTDSRHHLQTRGTSWCVLTGDKCLTVSQETVTCVLMSEGCMAWYAGVGRGYGLITGVLRFQEDKRGRGCAMSGAS